MVERIWLMSIVTFLGGMVAGIGSPPGARVPELLIYAGAVGLLLTVVLAAITLAVRIVGAARDFAGRH